MEWIRRIGKMIAFDITGTSGQITEKGRYASTILSISSMWDRWTMAIKPVVVAASAPFAYIDTLYIDDKDNITCTIRRVPRREIVGGVELTGKVYQILNMPAL